MNPRILLFLLSCLLVVSCNESKKPADPTTGPDQPQKRYSIVIDAGSSGSRIYIYSVKSGVYDNVPEVAVEGKPKKFKPGISAMATDEAKVMQSIKDLVKHAKGAIDSAYWADTPLYLMATAGMRLESKEQQEKTMKQLSDYLATSPFDFKKAMVISGQYEGLYAWIAANYLDDQFDPEQPREALVEMGGASTQLAYADDQEGSETEKRTYRGTEYNVFAVSYLGMGSNEAIRTTAVPECYPVGYPISDLQTGTGDCAVCAEKVAENFARMCDSIPYLNCLFPEGRTAKAPATYLAVSGFYYTFETFKFADTVNLDSLQARGARFCGKTWDQIQKEYDDDPEYLSTYCFNAAYYGTLLKKGYHLDGTSTILSTDKVDSTEVSWTLGAVIDLEMGFETEVYLSK